MEATCLDTDCPGVRTVLHMSPAMMAAAIVSAQKCGLNLREWLDRAVASLIADDHPEGAAPWSVQSADLFANVANCSPELLHGRWALLYEHVRLDRSLWARTDADGRRNRGRRAAGRTLHCAGKVAEGVG